jgi:hypothetical protein
MEDSTDTNHRSVEKLERGGHDSRCDYRGRHFRRRVNGQEIGEHRPDHLRSRDQAHRDVERNAETSLRSDERSAKIVSIPFAFLGAKLHDLPVRKNRGNRENVVERDSVLETVRTAGVFGHVPADGAGRLARWVRGVYQSHRSDRAIEPEIDDSRLDLRATVLDVDGNDFPETVHSQKDDAIGERTTRESRAGSARNEGEVGLGEQSHDLDGLVARGGENSESRLLAVTGESIRIVDEQLTHPRKNVAFAHDSAEPFEQGVSIHAES